MTDLPCMMSAPMVLATLREIKKPGTGKTNTRRLLYSRRRTKNGMPPSSVSYLGDHPAPLLSTADHIGDYYTLSGWHKVKPGDRLYVKENLANSQAGWTYAADGRLIEMSPRDPRVSQMVAWAHHRDRDNASCRFMPRWASRLTLIVTATKIERLQDINEITAMAEGARHFPDIECRHPYPESAAHWSMGTPNNTDQCFMSARLSFASLWVDLHGPDAWDANSEVVCITFKPVLANIDAPEARAA